MPDATPPQEPDYVRVAHCRAAIEWSEAIEHERAIWELETVKHLAIGNIAGLAGAAALSAGTAKHTAMFVCFGLGLGFAILCMYVGSRAFYHQIAEIHGRIRRFEEEPAFPSRDLLKPRSGRAKRWGDCALGVGWSSALATATGIGFLFAAVA